MKNRFLQLVIFPEVKTFFSQLIKVEMKISHIYLQQSDGTVTDLTSGENEKANFAGWARDLKHFYYISNGRDANYFDLLKMNIEDMTSEVTYENTDGLDIANMSNNEKYLVLTKPITTSSNEMILVNTETGERTTLSNKQGTYSPPIFHAG